MFFRIKPSGGRRYLQIVENKRVDGKVRQVVRLTIGRMDELEASGQLARLLASGARHCEQMMLLSAMENEATTLSMRRFGAPPATSEILSAPSPQSFSVSNTLRQIHTNRE